MIMIIITIVTIIIHVHDKTEKPHKLKRKIPQKHTQKDGKVIKRKGIKTNMWD